MNKKLTINTALPAQAKAKAMIIYTGGTFGMIPDGSGVLKPFDFSLIVEHLPALRGLYLEITVISFENPIDSSNVEPGHWQQIAKLIAENYDTQDGFVVLHGTDTMAFTASAVSFMLQNLSKPVVFTGAQLPISEPRSDARENLITSLEIATAREGGRSLVPEVCIYFDYELIRGCRSKKVESMHFDAFRSENYPVLAKAGVKIEYDLGVIRQPSKEPLKLMSRFDTHVSILKLFPGMNKETIEPMIQNSQLKALVIETFGAGNAPATPWFLELLKAAVDRGVLLLNISQCPGGMVQQGKYETSKTLKEIGVISGGDMTIESAITKLMLLLGEFGPERTRILIGESLTGEITLA